MTSINRAYLCIPGAGWADICNYCQILPDLLLLEAGWGWTRAGLDTAGQWGIVVPPAPGIFILGVMLGSCFL